MCWGRTQGGKILGLNKRFISLVRQPSEEVVILRTSQIREYYTDLLRVGEVAGASL